MTNRVSQEVLDRSYTKKTSTYTAIAGDRIIADCTLTAFTINLPTSPSVGDQPIRIKKVGTNTLTINAGSNKLKPPGGSWATGNFTIDGDVRGDYVFAYTGTLADGTTLTWSF